jgi:transposase
VPALLDRVYVTTPVLRADSAALRAMAAREKHPRAAMAHLAEGRSIHDAAYRVGAANNTVKSWLAIFRREGVEGLRQKRAGRAPLLAPEQLAELARMLEDQPGIAFSKLDALVRKRFGIHYTRNGLMRLIRFTLGVDQYSRKAHRPSSTAVRVAATIS